MINTSARAIAKNDLHSCICDIGIIAGTHHFVDLWARDSLFATFGALVTKDYSVVARTINAFLRHQRKDGFVPYRLERSPTTIGKYRGRPEYFSSLRPNFRSRQSGGIVPDGGIMTVIATAQYVRRSGDMQFLAGVYNNLHRAMVWYTCHFGDDLIREWFLCEWADSVLKVGKTLYTNVLYWKALTDFAWLAGKLGMDSDAKKFDRRSKILARGIQRHLWNGTFFADWINWRRQDYFSSLGNMMAVSWGLATPLQARRILETARKQCWNGRYLEEVAPAYPWWRIPIWNILIGMGDYHNRGSFWLQPQLWYTLALAKIGEKRKAHNVLCEAPNLIVRHGSVYEKYESDGRPLNRRWYRAEQPFAWSAGLYLWADAMVHAS